MKSLISIVEGILDAKSADEGIASEISRNFPELITIGLEHCQLDYKNGVLAIDCDDMSHCINSERKYKIHRERVDKNFWRLVKTLDVNSNKFMFSEFEINWKGGVNAPKFVKIQRKGGVTQGAKGSFMTISNASNITIDCSVNNEYNKTPIWLTNPVFSNVVIKGEYIVLWFNNSLPPDWSGLKCPDATHISIYINTTQPPHTNLWQDWLNDVDNVVKPFPKAKRVYTSLNFKSRQFKKEGNKWIER